MEYGLPLPAPPAAMQLRRDGARRDDHAQGDHGHRGRNRGKQPGAQCAAPGVAPDVGLMARASRWRMRAIAWGLFGFLAVAATVVWRRSQGVATARAMRQMEAERRALRAELVTLTNELRRVRSRRTVVQEAERRLGMHVAGEAEQRLLVPGTGETPP